MPKQEDVLFGKVAIKNRLIDADRVKRLLSQLEREDNGRGLGDLLVEKGLISQQQCERILAHVRQMVGSGGGGAREEGAAAGTGPAARTARAGAGSGAANGAAKSYHARDVAKIDFSPLAGKPLDAYLREVRKLGASDFHFQVDAPPFIRLHGKVLYLKHPVLTPEDTEPRVMEILDERGRRTFAERNDYDDCYIAEHGRYRVNFLRQRKGIDVIFRLIPDRVPTLEELHLPEVLKRFTAYRQGIVLITGPAGSGKTATMTALIDLINERQRDHIVTVEDPIEYVIPSKNCNVNQRQVERDTDNYYTALRSAMRSDPDYICVGEMRDLQTVSMAITAAETGHLVFATLHTTNAVRSVDRLIDVYPPKEQEQIRAMVSESLRGVVSQILVPRADGLGREPACEVLFVNSAVANMIREKKTFQLASVLQTGSKQGMVTMDDSLGALLKQKLITRETAHYYAYHKDRFK